MNPHQHFNPGFPHPRKFIYIWGVWGPTLVILVLCECIRNVPAFSLVLPAFDDTGFLGFPPCRVVYSPGSTWVTASHFHMGNRETELEPTTFSSLLLFCLSSSHKPQWYSNFESWLLGLLLNNNNNTLLLLLFGEYSQCDLKWELLIYIGEKSISLRKKIIIEPNILIHLHPQKYTI